MRFFSELNKTKIQCLKDHKNSICSNNTNQNKEIIEERPYLPENEDLISNFSDEDIESKSNNSLSSKSAKNRNTKSFYQNSRIIHEFSSHLEQEESDLLKNTNEKLLNNVKSNFYDGNIKKSFKNCNNYYDDTTLMTNSFKLSKKIISESSKINNNKNNDMDKNNQDNLFVSSSKGILKINAYIFYFLYFFS